MFGLPLGTVVVLAVIIALPGLAYGLHHVDRNRGDGSVTVLGYRAPSNE